MIVRQFFTRTDTTRREGFSMNACDILRRLHQHRQWVNHRLLTAAQELTETQLHETLPIGQGSVWKSLLHMYAAEYVWLEALLGNSDPLLPGDAPGKLPGNQEMAGGIENLDQLASHWRELDQRWTTYLSSLTPETLNHPVDKVSTSSGRGKRYATSRADVLLHVCTHAQYTTAQVVNMLRQLGQTALPDVMLITLARQDA